MKGIIVIDFPIICGDCPCCHTSENYHGDIISAECSLKYKGYIEPRQGIPSWCPLRPLPQKKKPLFDPNHCEIEEEIKIIHEIDGYNRCIDEIMGETE